MIFKKQIALLFVSLFSLVSVAWANPGIDKVEIRVLAESVVQGKTFKLGEVAELDGFDIDKIGKLAAIEIGRSPLPGKSRRLSRNQIVSKLAQMMRASEYELIFPKKTLVSRAAIKISSAQLTDIVLGEIKKNYEKYDDVNIKIQSKLRDVYVPQGDASYKIERVGNSRKIGGAGSWMLHLVVDNKIYKKVLVRAKIDVVEEVAVAKDEIPRGSKIKKAQLAVVKKNISNEKVGYESSKSLVVGQEAKRDIMQNETLSKRLVERPLLLEKGQPVRLVYETEKIFLSNMAVALKRGRQGDIIPVRTIDGKRTIFAEIVSEKQVRVAL